MASRLAYLRLTAKAVRPVSQRRPSTQSQALGLQLTRSYPLLPPTAARITEAHATIFGSARAETSQPRQLQLEAACQSCTLHGTLHTCRSQLQVRWSTRAYSLHGRWRVRRPERAYSKARVFSAASCSRWLLILLAARTVASSGTESSGTERDYST